MSDYSITLNIESIEDVYNFRQKIYNLIVTLSVEKTQPSRIASGFSTYLRRLLATDKTCEISIEINLKNTFTEIRVTLLKEDNYELILRPFFDSIDVLSVQNKIQLVKVFSKKEAVFIKTKTVERILTQKSKEELLREIEAKNKALQASFEDLKRTNMEKSRMENELNVAKEIQRSMLPLEFPAFPLRKDIDIYANLIPAREVGGDFYDFYFIDEVNIGIVVGDVSGKGVPAALMMAVCKTLLKSRASTDKSTASILTHVNNEMAKENKQSMFVTVFMGILNTYTGEMTYSNAGHNPSYVKKKNGELVKLKNLHGPVVAAMEQMSYRESKIQLDKEDILFGYTDGITEAHNINEELFSDKRLENFLKNEPFKDSKTTVNNLIEKVRIFEDGAEQFDDITAICLEYKGASTSTKIHSREIRINNRIEEVQKAMAIFEKFAVMHQISMVNTMKINIVLDEILSNIVKYGFPDGAVHEIKATIEMHGRKLVIVFSDDGIPFNPYQKTPPDLTVPLEKREVGGIGIHLVKKLMDEFSYKRNVNLNVVTMVKYNV